MPWIGIQTSDEEFCVLPAQSTKQHCKMVQLNYNGNCSNSFLPPPLAQVRFNFPIIQSDMHVCTGVERAEENRTEAASSESESSVSPCAICVCCVCLSDGEKSEHEDDKLNDTLLNRKFITRWCQKRQKLERSLFLSPREGEVNERAKIFIGKCFSCCFQQILMMLAARSN